MAPNPTCFPTPGHGGFAQGAKGKGVGRNIFCNRSLTAPDAKTFQENLNTVFSVHSKLCWQKARAHGRGEVGAPR